MACDINKIKNDVQKDINIQLKNINNPNLKIENNNNVFYKGSLEDAVKIKNLLNEIVTQVIGKSLNNNFKDYAKDFYKTLENKKSGQILFKYDFPDSVADLYYKATVAQEEAENYDINKGVNFNEMFGYDEAILFKGIMEDDINPGNFIPVEPVIDTDLKIDGIQRHLAFTQSLIEKYKEDLKRVLAIHKNSSNLNALVSNLTKNIMETSKRHSNLKMAYDAQIKEDLLNEIKELHSVIDNFLTAGFSLKDLSDFKIVERINFLSKYINNKDLSNRVIKEVDYVLNLEQFEPNPEKRDAIKGSVQSLTEKLFNLNSNIMERLVEEAPLIVELDKMNVSTEELKKHLTNLINNPENSEIWEGYAASISQKSPLFQLLKQLKLAKQEEKKLSAEPLFEKLNEVLDHIKTLSKTQRDEFLEMFIDKDENGVPLTTLVNYSSNKYHNIISQIIKERKILNDLSHNDVNKEIFYQEILKKINDTSLVIDYRKLPSVKKLLETSPDYNKYFTFGDIEMLEYEQRLKNLLGEAFEYEIEKIEETIKNFVRSVEINDSTNQYDLEYNNPFIFIENWFDKNILSNNSPIEYVYKGQKRTTENISKYVRLVPRKFETDKATGEQVETGYYNKRFAKISESQIAIKGWKALREANVDYINPTLRLFDSSINENSYGKIVDRTFEHIFQEKGAYNKISKASKNVWESLKNMFYANALEEKGNPKKEVNPNYLDRATSDIRSLREALRLATNEELYERVKDISPVLKEEMANIEKATNSEKENIRKNVIDAISKKEVLEKYSKDVFTVTKALLEQTFITQAALETTSLADIVLNMLQTSVTPVDRLATHFENWAANNIYGVVEYGTKKEGKKGELDADITLLPKKYTEEEKKLVDFYNKIIKQIESNSFQEVAYNFKIGGENNSEYESVYVPAEKGFKYFKIEDSVSDTGKVSRKRVAVDKTEYTNELKSHLQKLVDNSGMYMTPMGIIKGVSQFTAYSLLMYRGATGIFNRTEATSKTQILDVLEDFFPKGTYSKIRKGLSFYNTYKVFNVVTPGKKDTFQKLETFFDKVNLLQERRNIFESKSINAGKDLIYSNLSPFRFSIDLPEIKNQTEVILSVASNPMFKLVSNPDSEGNIIEVPFFDIETFSFPAFEVGKQWKLKKEFLNDKNISWQSLSYDSTVNNPYFVFRTMANDALIRTQGNYDNTDLVPYQAYLTGKLSLLYKRYVYQHLSLAVGKKNTVISARKEIKGTKRRTFATVPKLTVTSELIATAILSSTVFTGLGTIATMYAGYKLSQAGATLFQNPFTLLKNGWENIKKVDNATLKSNMLESIKDLNFAIKQLSEFQPFLEFALQTASKSLGYVLNTTIVGRPIVPYLEKQDITFKNKIIINKTTNGKYRINNLKAWEYDTKEEAEKASPSYTTEMHKSIEILSTEFSQLIGNVLFFVALSQIAIYAYLLGGEDDEERQLSYRNKDKNKEVEHLQRTVNMLHNKLNNLATANSYLYSISKNLDLNFLSISSMEKLSKGIKEIGEVLTGESESVSENLIEDVIDFAPAIIAAPVTKAVGLDSPSLIGDKRVYSSENVLFKSLLPELGEEREKHFEQKLTKARNIIYQKYYYDNIEKFKNVDKEEAIKDIRDKAIFKALHKVPGQSYEKTYERVAKKYNVDKVYIWDYNNKGRKKEK